MFDFFFGGTRNFQKSSSEGVVFHSIKIRSSKSDDTKENKVNMGGEYKNCFSLGGV